jgi:hypothetical protein
VYIVIVQSVDPVPKIALLTVQNTVDLLMEAFVTCRCLTGYTVASHILNMTSSTPQTNVERREGAMVRA